MLISKLHQLNITTVLYNLQFGMQKQPVINIELDWNAYDTKLEQECSCHTLLTTCGILQTHILRYRFQTLQIDNQKFWEIDYDNRLID